MTQPPVELVGAEFSSADDLLTAIDALRRRGIGGLETYTPFAVPGLADRMNVAPSRLPRVVFAGGAIGAVLSYGVQWFANVWDYPLNVGGRPADAVLAFIPATFEGCVLGAALGAFFGLLVTLGLPSLWHPLFEIDEFERATIDRYWVSIDLPAARLEAGDATTALEALAPLRVVRVRAAR